MAMFFNGTRSVEPSSKNMTSQYSASSPKMAVSVLFVTKAANTEVQRLCVERREIERGEIERGVD
jgi:hypothetical protein